MPVKAADILIPTSQISQDNVKKYFVISIGINNYNDAFWPTLKWPASDATRISDQLGKETNYKIEDTLLVNETATLNNVMATLNTVSELAQEKDTVVLYISGHGTLAQSASGEFERIAVMHDTKKSQLFTSGLPHSSLYGWMNGLKANKKLMILATCHSGEGKSKLPPKVEDFIRGNKGVLPQLSEVSEGVMVLAAAAHGEAARENDDLKGDVYTYYLLEALNTYDRNRDGSVSALEAHDYARDRTWAFTQGRQRPTANVKLVGDADVPLFGKRKYKGLPVLEAYDDRLDGFYVQVDKGVKGRLPTAFPLHSLGSEVVLYPPDGNKPIATYKVKVRQGESVTLDSVMNDRPFSIGMGIKQFRWSDTAWEKLSGSDTSLNLELNGAYHWKNLGIGILFGLPTEESNTLREPIKADVESLYGMLMAEYRYPFRSFYLGGRMEIGLEKMQVTLIDESTGDTLEFNDESQIYGLSLLLGYTFISDFSVTFEAGYRYSEFDFDTIGELEGERTWLGIGLDYRFGGVARTSW